MEYFNDERYWNIKLLNKWFAISSILFLASMVWIFIDDNDDDYKVYQKEFRQLSIENSEKSLEKELEFVEGERLKYEEEYNQSAIKLAREEGVCLVATNDVRFLSPIDPDDEMPSDFEAHEARVCIQKGEVLADSSRAKEYYEIQ